MSRWLCLELRARENGRPGRTRTGSLTFRKRARILLRLGPLATTQGFEPRSSAPEADVLPLDDAATRWRRLPPKASQVHYSATRHVDGRAGGTRTLAVRFRRSAGTSGAPPAMWSTLAESNRRRPASETSVCIPSAGRSEVGGSTENRTRISGLQDRHTPVVLWTQGRRVERVVGVEPT